ncbi:hypothetical protein [Pseudomonas sp. NFACC07-1]|uniref:hypothetical protein n=1 Tax=Pseudomonas sp. NFACC07-1 TaxID=1566239 RepID=UPI0008BA5046|nr:hypothetical protein [Pseudomonas sp. NFACC07-1]SEJ84278.1 hypothetical protein SAMN03159298_04654 [Pseudomonas sp. NFACC07-1]
MADSIEKNTLMWFGGLLLGAVTTTATAVHFLHENFITPIKVFESSQKVEKLTAQLDSQSNIVDDLNRIKEKLDKAQLKLSQIEHSNLFIKNNIYPATLETIKVGDNISRIYETYENSQTTSDNDTPSQPTISVDLKNSVFYRISYNYDPESKLIQSVAYMLDFEIDLGNNFLELAVSNALGSPTALGDKYQFRWQTAEGVSAYVIRGAYIVLKKGLVPRVWGGDRTH